MKFVFVGDIVEYDGVLVEVKAIYKKRGKFCIHELNGIIAAYMTETMHFIVDTGFGQKDVLGIECKIL